MDISICRNLPLKKHAYFTTGPFYEGWFNDREPGNQVLTKSSSSSEIFCRSPAFWQNMYKYDYIWAEKGQINSFLSCYGHFCWVESIKMVLNFIIHTTRAKYLEKAASFNEANFIIPPWDTGRQNWQNLNLTVENTELQAIWLNPTHSAQANWAILQNCGCFLCHELKFEDNSST